ncbi:MAG: hypothetical protein EU547_03105 [Promethearchaeota archaeon]|nr:MAG: hypothetical protein EU547_03105 [Candidatus Lokiarchaeota archaeon]
MKLIIDTNIIFSGLIKKSITREILLNPEFDFYIPEFYNIEFKKYKSYIFEKFEGKEKELERLIEIIHEKIIIVMEEEYHDKMEEADTFIGKFDPKDIPFIVLALSIENDGVWTKDKHFIEKKDINIFSTEDIISIYKKKLNQ